MNNKRKDSSSHENSSQFSSKDSEEFSHELPIDNSGYRNLVENFKKRDDEKVILKTVHTYRKLIFFNILGMISKKVGSTYVTNFRTWRSH